MAHRILIADPDEAFGLMLKQMLEMNGDYTAEYVPSGERALAAAQQSAPDLVILDLSVADIKPPALVQSLRDVAPMLRVMLIPVGDALPDDVKDIEIHGMLTKPFFIGDLGQHISHALGIQTKELVTLPPPIEKKATQPVKPRVRQIVETPTRLLESPETKPLSSPPAPPRRSREEQPAVTANNPTAPATSAPPPRVRQIIQPSTRTSERAPQPRGSPIPNNTTGWGRVDAFAAVVQVTASGQLSGTITSGGAPLMGAQIVASDRISRTAQTTSNASGSYLMPLAEGRYEVSVSAFGYAPSLNNSIWISSAQTTIFNVDLTAVPTATVRGHVTELDTGIPLRAKVSALNTPASASTDAIGAYTLTLPIGTYTLRVESWLHRVATATITLNVGDLLEAMPSAQQPALMRNILGWLGPLSDSTLSAPIVAAPNSLFAYQLKLNSSNFAFASSARVTVTLPAEVTLVSLDSPLLTYDAASRTIRWSGSLLTLAAPPQWTVRVNATAPFNSTFAAVATIDDGEGILSTRTARTKVATTILYFPLFAR